MGSVLRLAPISDGDFVRLSNAMDPVNTEAVIEGREIELRTVDPTRPAAVCLDVCCAWDPKWLVRVNFDYDPKTGWCGLDYKVLKEVDPRG